jgi:hypothetical protein
MCLRHSRGATMATMTPPVTHPVREVAFSPQRSRDELVESAQVLGDRGECELELRAVGISQPQSRILPEPLDANRRQLGVAGTVC